MKEQLATIRAQALAAFAAAEDSAKLDALRVDRFFKVGSDRVTVLHSLKQIGLFHIDSSFHRLFDCG